MGVECTEESRRTYRWLLFTTPGVEQFVSGVILFDETMRQKTNDGVPFPDFLARKGILPGIAAVGGGLMIEAGGSLLGAIGVSGAPGGKEDDACAAAGIAAIRDDLEF